MSSILKFPELNSFFAWLRTHNLHEYGRVIVEEKRGGTHGIITITFNVKLSARDPVRKEIVQCDLPFYRDLYMGEEHNRKEAEEAEKKMIEYIEKRHQETFKDYDMTMIPAQFKKDDEED